MGATDTLKDNVHAVAREAVNFFYEVKVLVVDWDTAQLGNSQRPSRRTGTVHHQPGEAPKLQ